jgi:hypothetical protein
MPLLRVTGIDEDGFNGVSVGDLIEYAKGARRNPFVIEDVMYYTGAVRVLANDIDEDMGGARRYVHEIQVKRVRKRPALTSPIDEDMEA